MFTTLNSDLTAFNDMFPVNLKRELNVKSKARPLKGCIHITIVFLIIFSSCVQKNIGTLEYNRLNFDTNSIAFFSWDTSKGNFPNNSDPLPLDQNDIDILDSLIQVRVDSFNKTHSLLLSNSFNIKLPKDVFKINLRQYKRQYFPYRDVNGESVISAICFDSNFKDWKNQVYSGRMHGGISEFRLRVNLTRKSVDYFSISGFG